MIVGIEQILCHTVGRKDKRTVMLRPGRKGFRRDGGPSYVRHWAWLCAVCERGTGDDREIVTRDCTVGVKLECDVGNGHLGDMDCLDRVASVDSEEGIVQVEAFGEVGVLPLDDIATPMHCVAMTDGVNTIIEEGGMDGEVERREGVAAVNTVEVVGVVASDGVGGISEGEGTVVAGLGVQMVVVEGVHGKVHADNAVGTSMGEIGYGASECGGGDDKGIEGDTVPDNGERIVADAAVEDGEYIPVDMQIVGDVAVAKDSVGYDDRSVGGVGRVSVAIESGGEVVLYDGVVVGGVSRMTECKMECDGAVAAHGIGADMYGTVCVIREIGVPPSELVTFVGHGVACGGVTYCKVQGGGAVAIDGVGAMVYGCVC